MPVPTSQDEDRLIKTERPTILVIDGDCAGQVLLTQALQGTNRVLFAKTAGEALDVARRDALDLIILDVVLPDMSGYDLCRILKLDAQLGHIPLVFLTHRRHEADERIALQLGAVDYWVKPVSVEIARIRVRNYVELKRSRDLLARLTVTDPLCQVANRRGLDEALDKEWRRAQRDRLPLSVLMLDIDYFKAFNDTYGHPSGDDCLRRVADLLRDGLARPADLVARYGGEEFACILPQTDLLTAERLAQSVRRAVEMLNIPHRACPQGRVTVSIGVAAAMPSNGADPLGLILQADKALYAAKAAGRNRVCLSG